jgi:hypothetical protein
MIFRSSHLDESRNIPLPQTQPDFFGDAKAVEQRWLEVRATLEDQTWSWGADARVLVLCVDGDTSRMATALLRARGREAFCVEGGYDALVAYIKYGRAVQTGDGVR